MIVEGHSYSAAEMYLEPSNPRGWYADNGRNPWFRRYLPTPTWSETQRRQLCQLPAHHTLRGGADAAQAKALGQRQAARQAEPWIEGVAPGEGSIIPGLQKP